MPDVNNLPKTDNQPLKQSSSAHKDEILRPGNIDVIACVITTSLGVEHDILPQVVSIDIFEDLYSPFMSGTMEIHDALNLVNLFPLQGEENLMLLLHTPTMDNFNDIFMDCVIYKMTDIQDLNHRTLKYVLHFISKEAVVDLNKKVFRGFKGKIDDIVQSLYDDELALTTRTKKIRIESAKNETRFISNMWNPIKCFQWVADHAINQNDSPSYLFWENAYGFMFASLDWLASDNPTYGLIWSDHVSFVRSESIGSSFRTNATDYSQILEIDRSVSEWDYFARLRSGMYGSNIVYYDLMTHQYVHNSYRANMSPDRQSLGLNKAPSISNNPAFNPWAVTIHSHQYKAVFNDYDDVSNNKTKMIRTSLLALAEASKIGITVYGHCGYRTGQVVQIKTVKHTEISKDNPDNSSTQYDGNYLISAIRHMLTRNSHMCQLELIKDSYIKAA